MEHRPKILFVGGTHEHLGEGRWLFVIFDAQILVGTDVADSYVFLSGFMSGWVGRDESSTPKE